MRYLTHDRSEVLIEGVDIDQTLPIARYELRDGGIGSVLGVWVIRDQRFTPAQAAAINELYLTHIDSLHRRFNIWHLTWAVSNIYRHGSDSVKRAIEPSYSDAVSRAREMGGIVDRHVNGDSLWMGDAHGGGRRYAHKHMVVPGNVDYLQSKQEFFEDKE